MSASGMARKVTKSRRMARIPLCFRAIAPTEADAACPLHSGGHPSLSLLISTVLRRSTAIGLSVQDALRSARPYRVRLAA